jgi:hypothetical protein
MLFWICRRRLLASFNAVQTGATSYHWDFGDGKTSDIPNPQHEYSISGTYHVCLTVTNACGSVSQCLDIWVQSSTSAILVELGVSHISCFGAHDGALEALAIGGSGTYQFQWLGPDGGLLDGPVQTGLGPGLYLLTVSDDDGNLTQVQVSIFEPTELAVVVKTIPPGISGPGIDLTVEGGTQGYSFLWNNGATSEDLILLPSGTYQCTVTDAHGCQFVTDPVRIINPRDIAMLRPGSQVQVIENPVNQPLVIIVDSDASIAHHSRLPDALISADLFPPGMAGQGLDDLRTYASGIYFLAIYEHDTLLKTIRLALWQ